MVQFDEKKQNERLDSLHKQEEQQLIQMLAQKYGHRYVNLKGMTINTEALILIDEKEAREAKIAAFEKVNKKVSVAIRNPRDKKTEASIKKLQDSGFTVDVSMSATESLEHAWKRYKDIKNTSASLHGVLDIRDEVIAKIAKDITRTADVKQYLDKMTHSGGVTGASEILELILGAALAIDVSDVHIEPEDTQVRLRFRLDGVLADIADIPIDVYKFLQSRLKLLAGLKLNIDKSAQDGRFSISLQDKEIEIRASAIPGAYGESLVMRILDPTNLQLKMDDFGINEKLYSVILEEISRPNGLIITTGPTGSGKTTALYSFLKHVHRPEIKIITLEDPIEYHLEGIVQTQMSDSYTFSSGLRAILRQDPDVIMVGEIRDREVAETAVNAALTGHLVFSTLHTNSAVGSIPRLFDLGVDGRMMGSAINLILAQRLVRRLCEHCKKKYTPTEDELVLIKSHLSRSDLPTPQKEIVIYKSVGCDKCGNTGYKGRIGLYEGIRIDKAVEEAVIRDPRESVVLDAARPQGIPTMQEDGVAKVVEGVTSLEEVMRVVDLYDTRAGDTASVNATQTTNTE